MLLALSLVLLSALPDAIDVGGPRKVLVLRPLVDGEAASSSLPRVLDASVVQATQGRKVPLVQDASDDPCPDDVCAGARATAAGADEFLTVRAVPLGESLVVTLERRRSDGTLIGTQVRHASRSRPELLTSEMAPALEELYPAPPPPPTDPAVAVQSFKRTALSLLGGGGMGLTFLVLAISVGSGAVAGGVVLSNIVNAWVNLNAPAYTDVNGIPLYDDRYRTAGYNIAAAASAGVMLCGFVVLGLVATGAGAVASALFAAAMRM